MAKATRPERVEAWLGRVAAVEAPPATVVAFNVGLLETPRGFSAYLVGADRFDPGDADWACRPSFTPAERYLPLPGRGAWGEVQADVVAGVRAFLASPAGRASFLGRAAAVTVGFDDGELERVA